MGILDDAIREHLELIRRRGATESEVQRLEDEAFGPPTRPDEADFPESGGAPAASGNGVATETVDEPSPEEAAAHEDVTTLLPATEAGEEGDRPDGELEQAAEPGTGLEQPTGAHVAEEAESEEMLVEHEEPAAEEHPIVEEPAPEPHDEVAEDVVPPSEEGTALYDQTRDELDIDLDRPLEDEATAAEAASDEHALEEPPSEEHAVEPPSEEHEVAEPEGTAPLEPPIESLDTVEHPFHEEIVEEEEPHEEAPPSDEYAVPEETAAPQHAEEEGERRDEGEESEEDVLADTPDFLKDAPEDDELWFEQGEPKDFDF
jgi:hypothetical protein